MMAEVVLDANVLVAVLDAADVHHRRAHDLLAHLRADGHELVFLDVLVGEAVSVLCRRTLQRRTDAVELPVILHVVRSWADRGEIRSTGAELDWALEETLGWVERSGAHLNFNDAFIVVLYEHGLIDELASFDAGFDIVEGLRRHGS